MEKPIITIEQGKLLGKTGKNVHGGTFYSFQGIPYAKPPLEQLRFKAPQPPEPWTDIRDATIEGEGCYSRFMMVPGQLIGSEDCLFLNVFTPQLPSKGSQLKPVMVWIHGGGFVVGNSKTDMYGPEYLLTEDIVLVTLNYRIGIFGFLSFDDSSLRVPGNAGLKDMVMALKWVQRNIKYFGGDPNNVTIFGESAGGAAVHHLVLSPMAKGLFHKAIAQSGCALNTWAVGKNISVELAKVLQLNNGTEAEILKTLQSLPVDKLFEVSEQAASPMLADLLLVDQLRSYAPVVEKASKEEEGFLTENPVDLIKSGKFNQVPFITGFTNAEGLMVEFTNKMLFKIDTVVSFESTVPHVFNLKPGSDLSNLVRDKIKNYFHDPSDSSKELEKYYMLQTDNLFVREINYITKLHAAISSAPVYFYRMSIESGLNSSRKLMSGSTQEGVSHGDDLGYLFKSAFSPAIEPNSIEDISMRRFVRLWTNFARYGDPNAKHPDDLLNVTWKPVTKNEINFLDIGQELTAGIDPEAERMAFWEEIRSIIEKAL